MVLFKLCIQAEQVFNMKLLTSLLDAWKTAAKGSHNMESLFLLYIDFLSKIWCCLIKFSIHVKLNMYSIWNYSPCFSTPGKQQQKVCTTWSLFVCLQFLFNNVCRLHYQPALQLLFEKLWEREVNKCSLVF